MECYKSHSNQCVEKFNKENVDDFLKGISVTVGTAKLYDASGAECASSSIIGTGMTLKVYYDSKLWEEQSVLIYGDANGDGKVNSTDSALLKIHILEQEGNAAQVQPIMWCFHCFTLPILLNRPKPQLLLYTNGKPQKPI